MEGISGGEITHRARESVLAELRSAFRPEFLNRVDETVLFKPLSLPEIEKIVDLLAEDLRRRLVDRGLALELTPEARTWIAEKGFDPVYGARPLRRYLQREPETRIGRALIAGEAPEGSTVKVEIEDRELRVHVLAPAGAERT
jgi:ATP-dependent Clp protease ATP-binding subunit ClpB